jgi:hypothetical protein
MIRELMTMSLALGLLTDGAWGQQDGRKKLPPEDVVEVPAIGEGLSVSNVFQSHMVLQRDKSGVGPLPAKRSASHSREKRRRPSRLPTDPGRRSSIHFPLTGRPAP